jgi:hypothetical protein
MRPGQLIISLAALATLPPLFGCSVHPLPEDVSRKGTYEIVEAIRCEARRAVIEYAQGPEFKGAVIGYAFDFDITENNAATASVTLQKKFADTALLKLPFEGVGYDKVRKAQRVFTIVDHFETLRDAKCEHVSTGKNLAYPITGSIGLYEVVGTFARLESQTNLSAADATFKGISVPMFSDTLTFTTELKGGSFKPSFTAADVTGKLVLASASMDLSASRKDIHKVTVALSLDPHVERVVNVGVFGSRARHAARKERTVSALRTVVDRSPAVSIGRPNRISETEIQASDDATARVLLELTRRRQIDQDDKAVSQLLQLLNK